MKYITVDTEGHIGGTWKAASSVENLASKETRAGTFNWDLSVRKGD